MVMMFSHSDRNPFAVFEVVMNGLKPAAEGIGNSTTGIPGSFFK